MIWQDEPEFPELPATQLAVNFPLVDVLPGTDSTPSNGPTEFIYGTHRLSVSEGQVHINNSTHQSLCKATYVVERACAKISTPAGWVAIDVLLCAWPQALIAEGNFDLHPAYMELGDVLIRDVRGLHRGTPVSPESGRALLFEVLALELVSRAQPSRAFTLLDDWTIPYPCWWSAASLHRFQNLSTEPREMIVVGYSRAWLRRPEVGIEIRRSDYEDLDAEGQSLLRFERIVSDDNFTGSSEPPFGEGWSPVYDSATLEKASGASYKSNNREEL